MPPVLKNIRQAVFKTADKRDYYEVLGVDKLPRIRT